MQNIFFITEVFIKGYSYALIDLVSIVSVVSGILVIICKNPIVSVLFLITLFSTISLYLISIGLSFIGLSYLLVYIGAISILFLFILMLINIRISELLNYSSNSLPLIILICTFIYYLLENFLSNTSLNNINPLELGKKQDSNESFHNYLLYNSFYNNSKITHVSSNTWDGFLAENSHIASIGNVLYSNYSMWLMLTSVILLLAMVGCIIITIKHTDND